VTTAVPPRKRWAFVPPFEAWIAVAALYAGLSRFLPLPPANSVRAVDLAFPGLLIIWSALYAAGGAAVLVGLFRLSPRIEGLGLNLIASGLLVATIANLYAGAPVLPTLVVSGGAIVACIARLLVLRALS